MPEPAIDPSGFKSRETLDAELDDILAQAPKTEGRLDLIVVRPEHDERVTPESHAVTQTGGLGGDRWAIHDRDPDSQICMMMSGVIYTIAGGRENWAPAGDNLFIDIHLTPVNMQPGTPFAIGTAEFVVTESPTTAASPSSTAMAATP